MHMPLNPILSLQSLNHILNHSLTHNRDARPPHERRHQQTRKHAFREKEEADE